MIRACRSFVVWAVAVSALLVAGTAGAQSPGRVLAVVKDADGKPVPDVKVTITSPRVSQYLLVKETNKKGRLLVSHADATLGFIYTFEKEGYQTEQRPVRPQIGGITNVEVVLRSAQAAPATEQVSLTGTGRAIRTFNEGVQAKDAGDLELAEQRFRQALELDPDLGAAHTALAALAHSQGDYATAAAEAEKALAADPSDVRALQIRYDAYRLAGDEEKAASAAEALRASGQASEAATLVYNEGVEAYRAGHAEDAATKFQQAVDLDPQLVPALVALGRIDLASGKNQEALDVADRALAVDPESSDALKIRYDAARALGDAETAHATLEKLTAIDPQWATTGLYEHGVDLYNEGQMEAAADVFRQVLAADPDHPRAHYLLGMAAFNLGQTDVAKEHLQRFLELAPDDPEAHLAREVLDYAK